MLLKKLQFKKNSTRLLSICDELIEKYQTHNLKPSCKKDLLEHIKNEIYASKEEVSGWKDFDTDYIEIAHSLLSHGTFDLLSSGKYHIYYGQLNPLKCADNLMDIYNSSMKWAVEAQLINEETRKEQHKYLMSCIAQVG